MLVITHRDGLAAALSQRLSGLGLRIHGFTPQEVKAVRDLRDLLPDIAFVDLDAKTPDNAPLHKAINAAVPDCQIILLCSREQSPAAAQLVRVWEAFDYLLADSELDPSRIPLMVERAQTDKLPTLSEMRGFARRQHRRILELLGEIKETLKTDGDSPVVRAIREYRCNTQSSAHGVPLGPGVGEAYRSCLVDVICGKLRRLEREIFFMEPRDACAERETEGAVLVVEDDPVSAELAKGLLEGSGFEVVVAKTSDAAKRAMSRHRPSVVLMDVHLGYADGLHLVRLMRRSNEFREVPVIVVTADRLRTTLFHAAKSEIQGYLLKPYQPKELIEKVKNAMRA